MELDQRINQLLHDAEHAESGYLFASRIGHAGPARELRQKRDRLMKEANELDPKHLAPAWVEHARWDERKIS